MCLRSTLCLWIAIAVLVQQSTFVCAQKCDCVCDDKRICPEIKSMRTDISSNIDLLDQLKPKVIHSEKSWENFKYEAWTEKVAAIENKTESLEGLKERLDEAESRGNSLQRDLENARKDFEDQLLQNISRMHSAIENQHEELKNGLLAEMLEVKNKTNILKSDIEEVKESRIKFREELLLNTSKRFSEVDKHYEELKVGFDTKLLNVENYTKLLIYDIVEDIISMNISEVNLQGNFSTSATPQHYSEIRQNLSSFQERLRNLDLYLTIEKISMDQLQEKMTNIFSRMSELEPAFHSLQNAIKELDIKVSEIRDKYESRFGRDGLRRRRELERPLIEVKNSGSSTALNKATLWKE